jgi:hypothetical protein
MGTNVVLNEKKLEPAGSVTLKRLPVEPAENFSHTVTVEVKPGANRHDEPVPSVYTPKWLAMATLEIMRAATVTNRTFFIAPP